MNIIDNQLVVSPRDLIAELECSHRLTLDYAINKFGLDLSKTQSGPELKLLENLGKAHEKRIIEELRLKGEVITIGKPDFTQVSLEKATKQTLDAIAKGVETITQACLFTGDFLGFADFLIIEKDAAGNSLKDDQGRFIYNPVDAKSARTEKRGAVLQVAAYAHAMCELGLARPRTIQLWLGGDKQWQAQADDLIDLAAEFLQRVRTRLSEQTSIPEDLWAAPRESCVRCHWIDNCVKGRKDADDICLTQGIRSSTRLALVEAGITTMSQLAEAKIEQRPRSPKEVSPETFNTLVAQADIQIRGRVNSSVILSEPKELKALGLLPPPSEGDIWFDMEGDPFGENGDGLEYMFGYTFLKPDSSPSFETFEATDRASEKTAFIGFIDMILQRQEIFPDMHIYHYAAYEPSRMGLLSQRHGVLEREVDQLLRSGIFVDLYSVVRKSFRFSSDSMSIKDVEQIYQGKRIKDEGVTTAIDSVIEFEKAATYRQLGDHEKYEEIVAKIRAYNKVDCDSTRQLDLWLRKQAVDFGVDILALRSEALATSSEIQDVLDPIAIQLMENIPSDSTMRTQDEQALALLASAVSFHWRESKPVWWNIFDRAKADLEDFESYNDVVLASNVSATDWVEPQGRTRNHKRIITLQAEDIEIDHIIEVQHRPHLLYDATPIGFNQMHGSDRGFEAISKIISIAGDTIQVEESTSGDLWAELPIALLPGAPINTAPIQAVLRDGLGTSILARKKLPVDLFPQTSWADLLLKRKPRQLDGQPLRHTGPTKKIEDIVHSLHQSANSYVAVQGPPGTGKTYVGKHVIAQLAAQGWKIGVTAQSHAVIENILDGVVGVDPTIHIAKKAQEGSKAKRYHQDKIDIWAGNQNGGYVLGGTVWTFSNPKIQSLGLDLIVIDEAGQFSLANTLAAASCAMRTLLLGDPQQLPQVSQATHPDPVEISVLGHLMGEDKTISDEYGYFLEFTYRMHPALTASVSRLQYDNRLFSDAMCEERMLTGVEPGLHIIEVEHEGNTVKSEEEANEILKRIPKLIGKDWSDVVQGKLLPARGISEEDIVIVAAYNRQVRFIKSLLAVRGYQNIRVGTVDKFQGQEAPIVFVSMATSSSEDLPRGIEFLLSPNRLNVAISRAQWACYLLRSPQLSRMEPASAKGMVYLGKFVSLCRRA